MEPCSRSRCSRLQLWMGLTIFVLLCAFDVGPIAPAMGISIVFNSISQVFLEYNGKVFCIGTVISPNYVLTAARCFNNKLAKNITIRSGTVKAHESGRIHQVDQYIIHEKYNLGNDFGIPQNNIALVNVTEPFRQEDMVRPMDLYRPGEFINFTTGAEILSPGCLMNTSGLLISWAPIIDTTACYTKYKDYGGLADGSLCVPSSQMGGCGGASGNPMIVNNRLVAIYSYKMNFCYSDEGNDCPAVHTRVSKYFKWIEKNAGLLMTLVPKMS